MGDVLPFRKRDAADLERRVAEARAAHPAGKGLRVPALTEAEQQAVDETVAQIVATTAGPLLSPPDDDA